MSNDLVLNLQNLSNVLPKVINQRLEDACQIVENTAKQDCPIDDGTLRASITHKVENNIGVIGTNIEYAPFVHQGTGLYALEGNGRKNVPWTYKSADGTFHKTSGIQPNPFLQNAFDKSTEEIRNCFADLFQNEV